MGWLTEAELTMVVTSSEGRDNLPTQKPRGGGALEKYGIDWETQLTRSKIRRHISGDGQNK